ncbi:MAG: CAP domain-containing protein [Alphaproteobacteria bacterium]|nr:CAP domain-containing protein [Alphaproteobacteria bacterium]
MRSALLGLFALLLAGCATAPPPPPPDPLAQIPELEGRIFELVNAERHAIDPKAKDLALDSELVAVARQRSSDMAASNGFAGGPADPHISATRLMAADSKFEGLLGENVAAQRFYRASGIDIERASQMIVASWLASASHKDNLSFADYSLTGVGAAVSADTVFVTQLFATHLARKPRVGARPSGVTAFPSAAEARSEAEKASAPPLRTGR